MPRRNFSGPAFPMACRKRIPISIRLALRSPQKGQAYTNPHPLQVWITVDGKRAHFGAVLNNQKLLVNPADWCIDKQASARRGDLVNTQITSMKAYIEGVFQKQFEAGGIPTLESVQCECRTGLAPEWSDLHGWVYLHDKQKRHRPNQYANCISADSPLEEAYTAYIAHLREQQGEALSRITLGRWKRGLFLLNEFADQTGHALPTAGALTIGWAKRFHAWICGLFNRT